MTKTLFDKSLFLTRDVEVHLQVVKHAIEIPSLDRVREAHRLAKAELFTLERSWLPRGGYACTLCAFCRRKRATDAHHLIYTKAMLRDASMSAKVAAEHRYNLAAVCPKCHREEPTGFRHALIVEKFRRYGYANVTAWVKEFQEHLAAVTPPTLPHKECIMCQNSKGGCPYHEYCDGQEHRLEMLCESCPYQYPDCAKCEKRKG